LVYCNLANTYEMRSVYDTALIYYTKALTISQSINDNNGIAMSCYNLATFYYSQSQYDISFNYAQKAANYYLKCNNLIDIVNPYRLIGVVYRDRGYNDSAYYFFKKCYSIYSKNHNLKGIAIISNTIGGFFFHVGNYDSAQFYYKKGIDISIQFSDKEGTAVGYANLSRICRDKGDYTKAIEFINKAIEIFKENGQKKRLVLCYNILGTIYYYSGNNIIALEANIQSLKICEELKDTTNIVYAYCNIADIHIVQQNFSEALAIYEKTCKILTKIDDKINLASSYYSIGEIYLKQKKYKQSFEYQTKALKLRIAINDSSGIASSYTGLGEIFYEQNQIDSALKYFRQSLFIFTQSKTKGFIASNNVEIALCYLKLQKYNLAIAFAEKGYVTAKEIGGLETIKNASDILSQAYSKTENYKKAYYYSAIFKSASDSLFNKENTKRLTSMEMQFEYDKKQKVQAIEQLKKDNEQKEKFQRQKTFSIIFTIAFVLMLILAIVIFRSYQRKQKDYLIISQQKEEIITQRDDILDKNEMLLQKNEEITAQSEEITVQRDSLHHQKQEIISSIMYAQKIQRAVLPSAALFAENLPEHFVLFKPRDIVSGDFYWLKQIKNFIILATADCTGHGVPGAFMSMLGISLLNEIVNKSRMDSSGEILNNLRKKIKTVLHQDGKDLEQKDGMDIALCIYDLSNYTMQYSGAYNSLYLVRENKLIEYKADKQPCAVFLKENDFTTNHINLQKNDIVYTFTDGYFDQIGGSESRKYMSKNFRSFLLEISHHPMNEQQILLDNNIESWKNNHDQIDDITIVGVKIT